MKIISKKKSHWVVALDGSEELTDAIEAWARASFEMARPAGVSAITSYEPSIQWFRVRTEALRKKYSLADPACILAMDYVAGRRCKTMIRLGRKYLTIFPGDGREQETETMFLLAMKYLAQRNHDFKGVLPQTHCVQ